MAQQVNGILLTDKCSGETSYGVVRKVKGAFGMKKVGHAGTLDPFATGLLIVLIGQGTRLSNWIMKEDKIYWATITLGIETDTMDCTGRVLWTRDVPDLTLDHIQNVADSCTGIIEQTPPAYSAVRYKGVRSYKLARRGIKVDLKKRKVRVHWFRILSLDLPDLTVEIKCSSGTYIRSLASALGNKIGSGAHVKSLRRVASGGFKVQDALPSDGLVAEHIMNAVISMKDALPMLNEARIKQDCAEKIRHGYQPTWGDLFADSEYRYAGDGFVKLVTDGDLVAIARVEKGNNKGTVKVDRVFHA